MRTFPHGWLLAVWCFSEAAGAQALPPSGVVDPILNREQLERQQQAEQQELRANQLQIPALMGEPLPAQQLPPSDETFTLRAIQFSPSRFLPDEVLKEAAARYVGRPVSFVDLNDLLQTVNSLYQERELITARAIIPPQPLADGALKVLLVEARLEKLVWSDEPERVDRQFFTDRISLKEGEVLDSRALADAIRRLNATTPGPQLSASLAKGDTFGTTQVHLETFEPEPYRWQFFANNHGSEGTGENQYGVSMLWFSPTGRADLFSGTLLKTDGSIYGNLRYATPVNRSNGIVYLDLSRNELEIERGPYAALNIEGESDAVELGYQHPVWFSPEWMLTPAVAYSWSDSSTTIDGFPLSESELGNFRMSALVEYQSEPWYVSYDQSATFADTENTLTGTSGNYSLLNGTLFAQRRFGTSFRAVSKLSWQYADETASLPSSLLYQLGGLGSVRGYEPGVVAAPRGYAFSLEGNWRINEMWEVGLLADYGEGLDLGTEDVTLSSVGLGTTLRLGERWSITAIAAEAQEEVTPNQDTSRLWVQITLQ